MASQSPLKAKPLRNPGDSIDKEIQSPSDDKLLEAFLFASGFSLIALTEWIGYLTHSPRRPVLFSCVALVACLVGAWRVWQIRGRLKQLRLGRDGERCVGQFLERLREGGGQVFHDIPAAGFNLDHVIISLHGIYAVETKTFSKPSPRAAITVESDSLLVAGRRPDRDPIEQVKSAALVGGSLGGDYGQEIPRAGGCRISRMVCRATRAARSGVGVGAEGSAGFHRKGDGGRLTERCRACCVSFIAIHPKRSGEGSLSAVKLARSVKSQTQVKLIGYREPIA
jgi:hypothetical protein